MKQTARLLGIGLLLNALCACAATTSATSPQDLPLLHSWSGTYPVSALHKLPAGQQHNRNGYIADAPSFAAVWGLFMPAEPQPKIDFANHLVIFSRNVRFFNRTSIVKAQLKDGVLDVLAIATMSAQPIRERVAMAIAVIPREGIERLRADKETLIGID